MVKLSKYKVTNNNGRYYLTAKRSDTGKFILLGIHEYIYEIQGEWKRKVLAGPWPEIVRYKAKLPKYHYPTRVVD